MNIGIRARTLIVSAVAVLAVLLTVGGAAFALIERTGYGEGVWLALGVSSSLSWWPPSTSR